MAKICVVCGVDCDGKPRVKDPQGQYYCRPCHDRLRSERDANGGANGDAAEIPDAELAEFAAVADAVELPPVASESITPLSSLLSASARKPTSSIAASLAPGWVTSMPSIGALVIAFCVLGLPAVGDALGAIRSGSPTTPYDGGRVIGGGVVLPILYYVLAPLWLRLRVKWSGGTATAGELRSAYFVTAIPAAIIGIIVALVAIGVARPWSADPPVSQSLGAIIPLHLALAAGVLWLYVIARERFQVKRAEALALIVAIPLAWYCLAVGASTALAFIDRDSFDARRPAPNPRSRATGPLRDYGPTANFPATVSFPSNWQADISGSPAPDADEPPTLSLTRDGDFEVYISLYDYEFDVGEAARFALRDMRDQGISPKPIRDISRFAGLKGEGFEFQLPGASGSDRMTLFLAPATDENPVILWIYIVRPENLDGASLAEIEEVVRSVKGTVSPAP